MNAQRLLQHFDRIAEAPDAIPRLRRFVLDLAVRGKLVEQDPNDEPASELLKRIQAERARLVELGRIRKDNVLPPIDDGEIPFDVPTHWGLVRLGNALELVNGRAFKPNEWSKTGLPIIRIQNLNSTEAPFNYCNVPVAEKFHVDTGDFLISWSGTPGTSFGAHIWDRGHAILNQHIFRAELIGDAFLPQFLKFAINSRLLELIDQAHGGVGLQHITKPKLEHLPLTLPPLAEQHRIVAKVDELMALCDRLEAAQAERESRRNRLVTATHARLSDLSASDCQPSTFFINHIPHLTIHPEHIQQLRHTVLNLAVHGRLVPQDKQGEPVTSLLARIAMEQRELIACGRLNGSRTANEVVVDSSMHAIPQEWCWTRLAKLISFGPQNGVSPKPTSNNKAPRAITLTATTSGKFNPAYFKHVELRDGDCENYWLSYGDVLFQRGNTREYVGMAAVFDGPEKSFVFPDLMIRVRISRSMNLRFIHLALISPLLRGYFSSEATGASSSMPKISQGILLNAPIPVPPLDEQDRIVAKVDELMALCDRLEAQLTTAQTESRRLLEALLHQALAPAGETVELETAA